MADGQVTIGQKPLGSSSRVAVAKGGGCNGAQLCHGGTRGHLLLVAGGHASCASMSVLYACALALISISASRRGQTIAGLAHAKRSLQSAKTPLCPTPFKCPHFTGLVYGALCTIESCRAKFTDRTLHTSPISKTRPNQQQPV